MIEEYILKGQGTIKVKVVYSKRKTLGITVKQDCSVIARVPARTSDGQLIRFIEEHRDWIEDAFDRSLEKKSRGKLAGIIPYEQLDSYDKRQIKADFVKKVSYYAGQMKVTYGNITIRNQSSRWGSCSSKGNLNFNYKLYYLEPELMDYVIIHELAHRVHMNHSKEFWELVANFCPEYKYLESKLKEYS